MFSVSHVDSIKCSTVFLYPSVISYAFSITSKYVPTNVSGGRRISHHNLFPRQQTGF